MEGVDEKSLAGFVTVLQVKRMSYPVETELRVASMSYGLLAYGRDRRLFCRREPCATLFADAVVFPKSLAVLGMGLLSADDRCDMDVSRRDQRGVRMAIRCGWLCLCAQMRPYGRGRCLAE